MTNTDPLDNEPTQRYVYPRYLYTWDEVPVSDLHNMTLVRCYYQGREEHYFLTGDL